MKKLTALLYFSFFFSSFIFTQSNFNSVAYFKTNEANLSLKTKADLTAFAEKLKSHGDYSLEIKAHTDNRGSDKYNLDLSNRRAESVINFLTKLGIESSKAVSESFGESRPDYSNKSEEGMSKNRRVDLLGVVFSIENMNTLLEGLSENRLQEYAFHSSQNVKLTGEHGTSIWIPANSFINENGKIVSGDIHFSIRESYSKIDMIANGLSTLSGGKMLETGGMIFMNAESDGQKLKLKDGSQLIIEMPTTIQKENMELFSGTELNERGPSDWTPTGQSFVNNATDYLKIPPRPVRIQRRHSLSSYNCDLVHPKKPSPPRKPNKPREPKREQFRYNPGFFKTVTLGKKKINQVEEKKYGKAMKDYKKALKKYHKIRYPNYIAAKAAFAEKLAIYQKETEKRELECREKRNNYYSVRRNEAAKYDSLSLEKYNGQIAVWKEIKKRRIEEFEAKFTAIGKINSKTLKSYFYQVNQLGWINCDRFWDIPQKERTDVLVNSEKTTSEEMVYIAFENIQSMIKVNRNDAGSYISKNLPKGENITIVGIKVENGRPQMAMLNTKIGIDNRFTLEYHPSNLKDMRKALEGLTES